LLCNAVGATRGAAQVPTTVVNGNRDRHAWGSHYRAAVSATHLATGVVRQTSSNTDGVYAIPDLPAGSYDVHIEATGFAAREFAAVELEAGRATTLDARLEVASVNSTVHVPALARPWNLRNR